MRNVIASKSLATQRWVAILPRQTTVGPGRDIGAHNAIERQWCYDDKGFGADQSHGDFGESGKALLMGKTMPEEEITHA
jgi:hypothetical protein